MFSNYEVQMGERVMLVNDRGEKEARVVIAGSFDEFVHFGIEIGNFIKKMSW